MFKDLFSNRLFIGALAFFVLIVGGGLLYLQHVKRQTAEELVRTQERIQALTEKQSPTAEEPVGDTSQGGHFHEDGTFHAQPHADTGIPKGQKPIPPSQLPLDSSVENVLTKEEEAERLKYWADMGLEPPPRGYGYQWDENGKISLYQYNVAYFKTYWSTEKYPGQDYSQLSQDEWKRHRALHHIVRQEPLRLTQEQTRQVTLEGKPFPKVTYAPGVVELAKEKIRELDRKASGPIVKGSVDITWNRKSTEQEHADIHRRSVELTRALESQKPPPPPLTGWTDETFFDALVKELEAEIQRR